MAPGGEVVGSDFSEGMLARAREKAERLRRRRRAPALRVGRRAGAALRRRLLRRRDGRLRRAQLLRSGARARRDGARGASGRSRGRAGDHHADQAAAVGLLRACGSTASCRCSAASAQLLGARSQRCCARSARRARRTPSAARATIADAYTYLPNSVKRFPAPAQLAADLRRAGLERDRIRAHRGRHRGDPRRHRGRRARRRGRRMSAVGSTPADGAADGIEGVDAIMRRGGEALRARMVRAEEHLERVTAQAGEPLAANANATIRAGGKRLRPLLVVLAAESAGGPPPTQEGEERLVRAAVAVELVHSATLVHDDLIDGAQLRRGRPTVAAVSGRAMAIATGDLLFSLAFAELARNDERDAAARAVGRQLGARRRRAAPARGRLRGARGRRALPAPLRAEDGGAVRGGLPTGGADGGARLRRAGRRAGRFCAAHRPGLSDARRRARRVRPGRAHGQGARHGPARRHGHAAADPRARTRP